MTKKPIPFPGIIGDRVLLEPDFVLDHAKGELTTAVIVGIDKDGDVYVSSSHGGAETFVMLERAKLWMIERGFV